MRRFGRTSTTLFFDPQAEPLAEVGNGERFIVETADSLCGLAKRRAPHGMHVEEAVNRLGGACPLTGPFFLSGAKPGCVVELSIHRVDPFPSSGEGWTGVFGGFGALNHARYGLAEEQAPEIRIVRYRKNTAQFPCRGGHVAVPMSPFLGTVGVAPRRERRMTFSQSPEYLGDVDVPSLRAGATVVLPVNVEGGLVSLGDAHGAQGSGEITGAALEIEAEVELSIHRRERDEAGYVSLPQINTSRFIGSVAGLEGVTLADCARAAYLDLIQRLARFHGYSPADAYQLLSLAGHLEVGNMIDPFYSVMASVGREYL